MKKGLDKKVLFCYTSPRLIFECVAQLVEHLTFNQVALGSNPSTLTILNKSSEKATFSFIYNHLIWFDWTQHKKHQFSPTIELIIAKVADFITFHIFDVFNSFFECSAFAIVSLVLICKECYGNQQYKNKLKKLPQRQMLFSKKL